MKLRLRKRVVAAGRHGATVDFGNVLPQHLAGDLAVAFDDAELLDQVPQLPDVARPAVGLEHAHRLVRQAHRRNAVLLRKILSKLAEQQMNVSLALAQRRQRNLHRVQTVVQVLAKLALVDLLEHVDVGRPDDAHVHFLGLRRAHLDEFAGFEHAEQPHLGAQGQLADFVEKNGSAVGLFKVTLAGASRPRKRPLFVAKKL